MISPAVKAVWDFPYDLIREISLDFTFTDVFNFSLVDTKCQALMLNFLKEIRECKDIVLSGSDLPFTFFLDRHIFYKFPIKFLEIFKTPCPVFKDKKIGETHLIGIISCENINEIGKAIKKYFPDNPQGFRLLWDSLTTLEFNSSEGSPYLVAMLKKCLVNTKGCFFEKQTKIVNELSIILKQDYNVPTPFEASFLTLLYYCKTGLRLFDQEYIICQKKPFFDLFSVGYFSKQGIFALAYSEGVGLSRDNGIAPILRFNF